MLLTQKNWTPYRRTHQNRTPPLPLPILGAHKRSLASQCNILDLPWALRSPRVRSDGWMYLCHPIRFSAAPPSDCNMRATWTCKIMDPTAYTLYLGMLVDDFGHFEGPGNSGPPTSFIRLQRTSGLCGPCLGSATRLWALGWKVQTPLYKYTSIRKSIYIQILHIYVCMYVIICIYARQTLT